MTLVSVLDWISRHFVRFAIYMLLPVAVLSTTLGPALFCHCKSGALEGVINRPIFHEAAERIGVRYSVRSPQFCCMRDGWFWGITIDAIDVELIQQPLLIHLDQTRIAPARGISVGEILVGLPGTADLIKADQIQTDIFFRKAETEQVQILLGLTARDSYLRTGRLTLAGPSLPHGSERAATLAHVGADGIEIVLQRQRNTEWNFDRARSLRQLGTDLATRPVLSLGAVWRMVVRLRRILLLVIFAVAALLVVVKLLLVRSLRLKWGRTIAVALAVLVSFACYAILFDQLSVIRFLIFSLLIVLVIACVLQRTVYRAGREWQQRWEPFALDLFAGVTLLSLFVAYGLLPSHPPSLTSVRVIETRVNNVAASLSDGEIGEAALGRLALPQVVDDNFTLELAPATAMLRAINIGRGSFGGSAAGDFSWLLSRFDWLPRSWSEPQVFVCGSFRDIALPAREAAGKECGSSTQMPQVSVDAAAGFTLSPISVQYAVRSRVRSEDLDAGAYAEGNEQLLHIGGIKTWPDSAIQVGGGSGTVTLNRPVELNLELDDVRFRDQVALQSVGAHFLLPTTNAEDAHLELIMRGFAVNAPQVRVTASSVVVEANQNTDPRGHSVSLGTRLRDVEVSSRRAGDSTAWLQVGIPGVRFQVTGRTPPGLIPGKFDAEGRLFVARTTDMEPGPGNAVLSTEGGLRFSLDPQRGALYVPEQQLLIRQSLTPNGPASLALNLSGVGQLFSLATPFEARTEVHVRIPDLSVDASPLQAEFRDVKFDTATAFHNSTASLTASYGSGWNLLTLPSVTKWSGLTEVSRLELQTEGSLPALPPADELQRDASALLKQFSTLSKTLWTPETFKFDGAWPAKPGGAVLRLQGPSGVGIAIRDVAPSVNKLFLPALRFEALDSRTEFSHVETRDGKGDLNLVTALTADGDQTNLRVSIPLQPDSELAFKLRRGERAVEFGLEKKLLLGSLQSQTSPFLRSFGVNLDGVSLDGQVDRFQATAQYSGTQITGFDADAALAPGPILSLDLAKLTLFRSEFFRHLDLSSGAGGSTNDGLHLRIAFNPGTSASLPTDLSLELSSLDLRATDDESREYHAGLSINSRIRIGSSMQAAPPGGTDADKLRSVFTGLGQHVNKLIQLFGNPASSEPGVRDVHWAVSAENRSADQPVLSLNPTNCALAIALDIKQLSWLNRRSEASSIHSTIDVQTDFTGHGDELVVDGYVPVDATVDLSGAKEKHIELRLPFLILLANQLRQAGAGSDSLFDSAYYDAFWANYHSVHPSNVSALWNAKIIDVGPLAIEQFRIPGERLRLAVGYGSALELYAPLSAQVMFGQAGGGWQSSLSWPDPVAPIGRFDARLNLNLQNLQASAFGLSSPQGVLPLLDDQLDGDVNFRANGLTLSREMFGKTGLQSVALDQLDRFGISVRFRSVPDRKLPGVVQAIARVQLKSLNEIMRDLARDLQLQAPPHSLSYESLSFNFEAANGKILATPSLLEMRGMRLFSTDLLALQGDFRTHLGTEAEPFSLRGLVQSVESALAADGVSFPGGGFRSGNTNFTFRRNR